jgi:hypothetical protein
MQFEKLGNVNLLWFLISVFLAIWLGQQLLDAVLNLEILNLRVSNIISFKTRPLWFSFVFSLKFIAWLLSASVVALYLKRRLWVT